MDRAAAQLGRARMKDSLSRVGALDSIRQMDANPSFPANPEPAARAPRPMFRMDLKAWIRDILLSLALATVVIVFLCQPVKVEGTSMLPELADKQRVFVNKLLYRIDSIARGDVIVFRLPEDSSRSYIKRVVGLPGETVEIRQGSVYIDGQPLPEPYVPAPYRGRSTEPPVTVPGGQYYVLGDHRNTSNDSRTWGTVDETAITGKAVFAYWPPERIGVVH